MMAPMRRIARALWEGSSEDEPVDEVAPGVLTRIADALERIADAAEADAYGIEEDEDEGEGEGSLADENGHLVFGTVE